MARRAEVLRRGARLAAAATVGGLIGVGGCGGSGGGGGSETQTAGKPSTQKSSGGISSAEQRRARKRLAKDLGVSPDKLKKLRSGHGLGATTIRPAQIVAG